MHADASGGAGRRVDAGHCGRETQETRKTLGKGRVFDGPIGDLRAFAAYSYAVGPHLAVRHAQKGARVAGRKGYLTHPPRPPFPLLGTYLKKVSTYASLCRNQREQWIMKMSDLGEAQARAGSVRVPGGVRWKFITGRVCALATEGAVTES